MSNKKVQCCALCKNHKEVSPKKGHQCQYRECPCLLCELTKNAQNFMRHQQRFWRHQKSKLKNYKQCPELKVDDDLVDDNGQLKGQVCDKCRNHNHLTRKKNHNCPYLECDCQFCFLTFKRRKVMKHQQRVRRSNITTKIAIEPSDDTCDDESLEDPSDKEGDTTNYQKLSLLFSSMNAKEKKDFFENHEEMFSGRSSAYSNTGVDPSEEIRPPASFYDSRSRSSPPPLIPIDLPDSEYAGVAMFDHDDESSTFEARREVPSPKLRNDLDMEELNPSLRLPRQNSPFSNSSNHTSAIISASRHNEFIPAPLARQGNSVPNLLRQDDYFFVKQRQENQGSPVLRKDNTYLHTSRTENSISDLPRQDRSFYPQSRQDNYLSTYDNKLAASPLVEASLSPLTLQDNSYASKIRQAPSLSPPLSIDDNSYRPKSRNENSISPLSRFDETVRYSLDMYEPTTVEGSTLPQVNNDWKSYVQPPSVFQTTESNFEYNSQPEFGTTKRKNYQCMMDGVQLPKYKTKDKNNLEFLKNYGQAAQYSLYQEHYCRDAKCKCELKISTNRLKNILS